MSVLEHDPAPLAGPEPVPDTPAVPARGGRLGARSLTWRLVGGVVALVVVVVTLIGSGTYYFLHSSLLDQLDTQVRSTAQQTAGFVERCVIAQSEGRDDANCQRSIPGQSHEWIYVWSPDPSYSIGIRNGDTATQLNLTPGQVTAFLDNPSRLVTDYQNGKELRVTAVQTHTLHLLVVTGLSTDEVDRTMHNLLVLELLIGGAAVAVAVIATTLGVRRSLRNLYRVTGTAREVAAELSPSGSGLDRRVPVVEEGTEVGQLAESFNTMLAAVETQFAARVHSEERMRQFMADASHELRTPLTSIRGYAELARMQRASGETSEDNLSRIESEGTRMSRLVEDLLMLARGDAADSSPLRRELIDVDDLLDDVVSGARASFPERHFDIDVIGTPRVLGDRDQLVRLVRNLVTNAAVHTDPARPILVRTWQEGEVIVQVVDGGPGLPPEQAAQVFERFWRADKARSRARGGTGLGMSIVASIARAHGGTVQFQSSVELGSTVTVRLPAAEAE